MRHLAIAVLALVLASCASKPSKPTEMPLSPEDQQLYAQLPGNALRNDIAAPHLQRVLMLHGIYISDTNSLALIDPHACGGLQIEAHRGHPRQAENSLFGIYRALGAGAHGVEIDAMRRYDGNWVLHHDPRTGRAAARIDGKQQRVEQMDANDWGYMRLRHPDTGLLTDAVPPSLAEAIRLFGSTAQPWQFLNIELKSMPTIDEAFNIDRYARKYIAPGQYRFSSTSLEMLEKLRGVNPDVYLGFIQEPVPASVAEVRRALQQGAKDDELYRRHTSTINFGTNWGQSSYNRRFRNFMTPSELRNIARRIGPNAGVHLDIRQYDHRPDIRAWARAAGFKQVSTYSINSPSYHVDKLLALQRAGRLPDTAIVDVNPYHLCRRLQPRPVDKADFEPIIPMAQLIMRLPSDADLEKLEEQQVYAEENLYLALDGSVRSLAPAAVLGVEPVRAPAPPTAVPADVDLDYQPPEPIRVQVPQ